MNWFFRGAKTSSVPGHAPGEGRVVHPKGTLGNRGQPVSPVGGAYLAVAAGVDHLVAEFGIAAPGPRPIDRAGGGDRFLAVAAQ